MMDFNKEDFIGTFYVLQYAIWGEKSVVKQCSPLNEMKNGF